MGSGQGAGGGGTRHHSPPAAFHGLPMPWYLHLPRARSEFSLLNPQTSVSPRNPDWAWRVWRVCTRRGQREVRLSRAQDGPPAAGHPHSPGTLCPDCLGRAQQLTPASLSLSEQGRGGADSLGGCRVGGSDRPPCSALPPPFPPPCLSTFLLLTHGLL